MLEAWREDAAARGIRDGDRIRVFNDIDSTELAAKVTPAHSPGMVTIYHAWEPFQFKGRKSHAALTPNPINPEATLSIWSSIWA